MTRTTKTIGAGLVGLLAWLMLRDDTETPETTTGEIIDQGSPVSADDMSGLAVAEASEGLSLPEAPVYDFEPSTIRDSVRAYLAELGTTKVRQLEDQLTDLIRAGAQDPDRWMQYATDQTAEDLAERLGVELDAARWAAGVATAASSAYDWTATQRAAALGYLAAVAPSVI